MRQPASTGAKLFSFPTATMLDSEIKGYDCLIGKADAVVLVGVHTGGVPSSLIDFIKKATEAKTPIYIVRGTGYVANGEQRSRGLTNIYQAELDAIKAGAIPLEYPDGSVLDKVIAACNEVYKKKPSYEDGIEMISERFSSVPFRCQVGMMQEKGPRYENQLGN